MRDPNRLDSLYDELKKMHKRLPDQRFGQLMSNFLGWAVSTGKCSDIWFPEDNKWAEWFKEYAKEMGEGDV